MYKGDMSKMMVQQQQAQMQQSQQAMMMNQQGPTHVMGSQVMQQQMAMSPHIQNQMSQEQHIQMNQQMQMQQSQQMQMQQNMQMQHQMHQQQQGLQQQQMQQATQQQAQQQQQVQQHQQQQEQKHDNISKVKTLTVQLNDTLMDALRIGGVNLLSNSQMEGGNKFGGELTTDKLEECMEKFYSVCDQMELHLKTAAGHQYQSSASHRYTPTFVSTNPPPDIHKYTHYVNTVKQQVSYAKEVHNSLVDATTGLNAPLPLPPRPQQQHHDSIAPMETQS